VGRGEEVVLKQKRKMHITGEIEFGGKKGIVLGERGTVGNVRRG